ncbi:hypothetical protein F8S13_21355 [Chloroflexia bacterium SDU3-3]|nr:hypothetical protein F8S13_21355 [Chloroflexia bacterium SDU3-3]
MLVFDGEPPLSLGYALGHIAPRGWADWAEITRTLSLGNMVRWGAVVLGVGAGFGAAAARKWARPHV